ncbi:hypothetical protein F511_37425 [Dorcoceras hygrometricum]|uniref:Uncharacterized protein n=1 Tax=Dorcoceras hygrometricum TaxID=472368 RepID=A0A2Z7CBY6_9LAMI|nr:hypothetical protein F511_37425 [Dorcoceras hygrometricum]
MVVIPSRLSYVDTLPPMSEFFKLLKKRWGDVCIEVAKLFASGKLLPVGSVNFCRSLAIVEPVSSFVSRRPTVFSLRLSQFCTVFVKYSLFSRLSIDDIISFVSTIAMDRTILRDVQILQNSVSVAPNVQMVLDQRPFSSSTSDTSAMHFNETDTVVTLAFRDTLRQLEEALRNLIHSARQDGRTLSDVQTIRLKEFRKGFLAHGASVTADLMDVRKEVQKLNARVDIVAKVLDDVRKDVEATKEAISHQILDFCAQAQENHNILTDQLGQLVDYINRGGNDKKGEDSIRGPQPPQDDQDRPGGSSDNRGSGGSSGSHRRGQGSGQ